MAVYFRRPQTPFVTSEGIKADVSQWRLVSETNDSSVGTTEHPSNGHAHNDNGGAKHSSEPIVQDDPMEEDETEGNGINNNSAEAEQMSDQIPNGSDENDIPYNDSEDERKPAARQSLNQRLQHELKHHPESVLLCGYFHEYVLGKQDDNSNSKQKVLYLTTYLPGVKVRELRVYYGEGVLQIGGARALYNLVQRFERSFAVDERLVQTNDLQATLQNDGTLTIQVPLVLDVPLPQTITVVAASPMILFRDRSDLFCLDIDVPGVYKVTELHCEYSNGTIRLIWEKLQIIHSNDTTTNNSNSKQQMRFEREIHINTLQIDTNKIMAYLDHHTKNKHSAVLTIVAPRKFKRATRPIQVMDQQDTDSASASTVPTVKTTTTATNPKEEEEEEEEEDQ